MALRDLALVNPHTSSPILHFFIRCSSFTSHSDLHADFETLQAALRACPPPEKLYPKTLSWLTPLLHLGLCSISFLERGLS